jgi:large subunit ribosomal protein L5
MNPMKEIRIEKVTLNIGVKEAGAVDVAKKLLEKLTEKKIVVTRTKKRTTFGVSKGRPIGVKVTIRGEKTKELLKKLLDAVENKLNECCFDDTGNFSFGIDEYINIPGLKYDPEIGIIGMDVCITLERPGYRVKRRRIRKQKIGKTHRITKEEAMEFAKKSLGVKIVKETEEEE